MTNPQPSSKDNSSILKETRQHKGISLEMVHEATKIPLDALKAIEEGYSVHRLPPFYYRGFIRIYSKYLDLDETKVLQSYGVFETAAPKPQPASPSREFKPRPKPATPQAIPADDFLKDTLRPLLKRNLTGVRFAQVAKLIGLLVGLVLLVRIAGCLLHKGNANKMSKQSVQKIDKKEAPVLAPKAAVKEKPKAKKEEPSPPKQDTTPSEKIVSVPAASATPKPSETKPKANVKTESKAEAKTDKKAKHIELTVRATKNGWLQVKTDGQIVFQSILKKGAAETWSAVEEIELSGKNINLLEFELNGKMLGALGPSDRGAKRVVFTKDGLSVKK